MNYIAHYARLIDRARGRILTGYKERHHVLPRCLGGGDERGNLVLLTAEEHYVAHQLLVKMHPGHIGLVWATVRMAQQCSGNKAYGWLRRRYSKDLKGNANAKGMKHSEETKARIASSLLGRKRPPRSPEWGAKISASKKGKPINSFSPAHRV